MTQSDAQLEAQQYIDKIVAVSRRHGAATLSKTAQREAVKAAAAAYTKVKPAK